MFSSTHSIKSGTRVELRAQRMLSILLVSIFSTLFTIGSVTVAHATVLAVGPVISVTKTDTFVGGDGDGKADPGETIRYTTTISNTAAPGVGNDATGVTLTDIIDLHTTLAPGSVRVSPIAVNDTYTAIGNVSISPSAGFGLLANDFLGLNPAATVASYDTTGTAGTVTGNADGSFTYDPPAGFTGTDIFHYTLSNIAGSDIGTVTITVSGLVWFVDNTSACASSCDGRLSHPFTTLAAFSAVNDGIGLHPANNHNIFVYESAIPYTGGVTLRSGQKLIGQDATATLTAITGLTPPSGSAPFPTMNTGAPAVVIQNAGGNGVTLNSGNTLRGFTASNASGSAISGSSFGTLTVDDMVINTNGQALSLNTGTVAGSGFTSVTSSGGANNISLQTIAGTLPLGAGTLSGASGASFSVSGGTVSATYSGNVTQTSASPMVSVAGGHAAGTITFQTGTLSATNGSGLQLNNADGTYNFNSTTTLNGGDAGIDIINGSGGAFTFASGATITNPSGIAYNEDTSTATVSYNGSISKTNNANNAVSINAKTGGTTTFVGAITGTTTTANAINLTSNTGGTVTFTGGLALTTTSGLGFNATGGGTVSATQNNTSIVNTITSTSGTALKVTGTTIGASGLTFRSISSNGAPNGIFLSSTGSGGLTVTGNGTAGSGGTIQNSTGSDAAGIIPTVGENAGSGIFLYNAQNVSLARMQLNGHANFAIYGNTVSGFTLANSVVSGSNGTNATVDEASIAFNGLTGTASITGASISGGVEDNFRVRNTSGSLGITFDTVTIGANNTATGNDGINLEASGNATINPIIKSSVFTSAAGDLFQLNLSGNAASDLVIRDSTLSNNHPAIATGGGGVTIGAGNNTGSVNLRFHIYNNTFRDADGHAVLIFKSTDPGTVQGTFENNTVGVAGIADSGSVAGSGIKIQNAGLGTVTVAVLNNQIHQYNNFGVELLTGGSATAMSGAFNATVTGNVITNPGTGGLPMNGIQLNGGTVVGDTYAICTDIGGAGALANTINGSGLNGGTDVRVRQRQATTVRLPGYGGANNDNTAVQTYLSGRNIVAPSALASNNVPTGGGFTGGGACAQPTNPVGMLPQQNHTVAQSQLQLETNQTVSVQAINVTVTSSSKKLSRQISWAKSHDTSEFTALMASNQNSGEIQMVSVKLPAPALSGETVTTPAFTLPAGKSVIVQFDVTVDPLTLGVTRLLNQGTVSYAPSQSVLTTDPTPNADPFCIGTGPQTCTPIDRPDANVTSIARHTPAITSTNAASVVWRVTFDTAVAGLTSSNFALANAGLTAPSITSVSAVTGSPDMQWDVTVNTGTGDGTLGLNMVNDTGLSHDVFTLPFTGETYTIDKTAPKVASIVRQSPASNPTNADVLVFRVTFDEAVTSVSTNSFVVTGTTTTINNVQSITPNLVFDFTLDGTVNGNLSSLNGTVGLDVAASPTIKDLADNTLQVVEPTPASNDQTYTVDNAAPTVTNVTSTASNGSYTTGAVIPVTVTFNEAVTVTGTPQLTLETGATDEIVNYTSGSGTATLTFNYTVQAGDTSADLDYFGATSLALNGGTIKDATTNNATLTLAAPGAAGSLGNNKNIVIDTTAPTVTNVTSTAANGSYTTGAVIPITVTFNEVVMVTGTPQLTLETGATDQVVNYTSGSGTATLTFNYTVQAGDTSTDLEYKSNTALALNGGTVKDAATNNASLTLAAPGAAGSLGFNKAIVIDTTSPIVANITSTAANGTYGLGAVIPVTVTFSEPVTVTGTPQLTLAMTGTPTTEVVDYTSGSGTATLTFTYTAQFGDVSPDLDYAGTNSLALSGGTIKDIATNNAVLTLPTPGNADSLGFNKNIVINATNPVVTNVTSTATNGSYKAGAAIPVTVTFSSVVTVTGTPQLTLETGATDEVVNYTSGSGTNTLTFNYTVGATDNSLDLDYVSTTSLALNSGTIQDASLNDAVLTLPTPGAVGSLSFNKAIAIDTITPTITNVTSTATNGSYTTGAVIPVTVTFSEAVTVTGTPQLTLETGTTDEVVNYASGSSTNTLTFNYTVQAGDISADLDYKSSTALALNGGAIADTATNNATITLASPGAAGSLGNNKNILIDTTTPTVTNVTSTAANGSYTIGAIIPVTVTFSEAVTVTGTPQLTLETGATDEIVNYTSGSGTATLTFNYTASAGDTTVDLDYVSTNSLALNGGTIIDAATNAANLSLAAPGAAGSLGANKNIVIDTTLPTVTNVTSTAANGTYGTGAVIPVTVTFSETVIVTGTPQLTLETGATDEVVNYTSGTGTNTLTFNYTTQLGDSSADLDYVGANSLALNGGTIKDAAANNASLTLASPGAAGSLGANKNIVIDTTAPTVTNVNSIAANGSYTAGAVIPVTVTFSEAVNVTGIPQLTLETGATDQVINYTSGSGTTTLTFNYTVQAGNTSVDLDYVGTTALALNGGTIKDAATNNVTLTLASPGAAGSLGANKNIVIDTTAPTVTNVTSTSANGTYTSGAVIPVTVTFSEAVTVTGTPQLTLETGATDQVVNYTSGSGTTTLTFNYTVQAGDTSADLDYVGTTALALNSGTIKDAATNNATLTLASPGAAGSLGANKNIVIDTTAPTVVSFTATTPTSSLNIPITGFTASDAVGVTGYLITESSTPPGSGAAGWNGTAPTTYTVASVGTYTLYPWAKDAAGNVSGVFGTPLSVVVDTAPTVDTFTATTPTNSLSIPITAFTASDNLAVTGYLITESSTPPGSGAAGWNGTAPTTYTVASAGTYTLYPWAKDAIGNVSAVFGTPCTVVVDTIAPTVDTFTVTTPTNNINIPLTAFTASDNAAVTGYLITESSTPPTSGALGWSGTAPTTYTVGSSGTYTLYPWAKDAAGNVSVVFASPRTVVVDITAPTISGNAGTGGAILSYMDGILKTVTADGSGNYTFVVLNGWSDTVTPSKPGYTFSPTSRTYTNVTTDQSGQNYTATGVPYFAPISMWTPAFDYSHGWRVDLQARVVGDINGDGKDDLVGFAPDGVYVALSNGTGFDPISRWTTDFDLSHSWTVAQFVRTVGDVNGDGKADLVGFGLDGVYVALSTGTGFDPISRWTTDLNSSHGWTVAQFVRTVGDIDGDGKADLVGFGLDGVYVALSTGTGFGPVSQWTSAFDLSHGWTVAQYVRTVGDIDGDGKADLVGFGLDGVYVALSTGTGFGPVSQWTSAFDLSHGWTVAQYVRTVGDVNGDGKTDLVGFGLDGVYVALSTGTGFGPVSQWTSALDLSHGWTVAQYVRTVGDVNGDGRDDVVGFGFDGVYIGLSNDAPVP